jgi:hypothetical protein
MKNLLLKFFIKINRKRKIGKNILTRLEKGPASLIPEYNGLVD